MRCRGVHDLSAAVDCASARRIASLADRQRHRQAGDYLTHALVIAQEDSGEQPAPARSLGRWQRARVAITQLEHAAARRTPRVSP